VAVDELTALDIEQWSGLALRALEKNPYLAPEFILPSLRIRSSPGPLLMLVARVDGRDGPEICGLGAFEPGGPVPKFPLRHLVAYRSRHSYLTGLLVRTDVARDAARAMLEYLVLGDHAWQAAYFSMLRMEGPQAELLRSACDELGIVWYEDYRTARAGLDLAPSRREAWRSHVSRQRHKDVRRCVRKLEQEGPMRWKYVSGKEIDAGQVDGFLDLEDRGWKAGEGTSLRSSPADEQFFRELVRDFAEKDRGFFTELWVGDRLVASTSNLTIGSDGFAFKVAYDPDYRRMSPGIVNEYTFLEALDTIPSLASMDSGAAEGSFIDHLWPERTSLGAGYLVGKRRGKVVTAFARSVRAIRRALKEKVANPSPDADA
jgi:hypothetical protein